MKTASTGNPYQSWKPLTGGILSIVAGAINLFIGIILITLARNSIWVYPGRFRNFVGFESVGTAVGIILAILAIVAIVGGSFAVIKRLWGLALAGAICALVPSPGMVLGIPSLIFISMSNDEFDHFNTDQSSTGPSTPGPTGGQS